VVDGGASLNQSFQELHPTRNRRLSLGGLLADVITSEIDTLARPLDSFAFLFRCQVRDVDVEDDSIQRIVKENLVDNWEAKFSAQIIIPPILSRFDRTGVRSN